MLKLKKIPFNPQSNRGRRSPTWSWLKYEGGISYISPKGRTVNWDPRIIWPTDNNLDNMRLEGVARTFQYPVDLDAQTADSTTNEEKPAILIFDEEKPTDVNSLHCVVLGTDESLGRHYVLLVQEMPSDDGDRIWGRIGVGYLPAHLVQQLGDTIVIQ